MSDKLTVVKYTFEGEKFEILVKPDPALDYKLGKIKDISSVLVSDEIYQNSGEGTRASSEKLQKSFKTEEAMIIAEKKTQKGDLNLPTAPASYPPLTLPTTSPVSISLAPL